MANISRRHFLRNTSAMGFATSFGALSALAPRAHAASTGGYKAMVCISLKGGMDHADTVLPYDQASYDKLAATRASLFESYDSTNGTSSRFRENLLKLNPNNGASFGGREFALPQALAPLHQMFEDGDLAIVGGTGPLIEPTAREFMSNGTAILPNRLYSHNDQQSTWMSLSLEGRGKGWGGLMLDAINASSPSSNADFMAITPSSNDAFLFGNTIRPYRISNTGATVLSSLTDNRLIGVRPGAFEARERLEALIKTANLSDEKLFSRDIRGINANSLKLSQTYTTALNNSVPMATTFANDSLSSQMNAIARTIQIQQSLNAPRQTFYATLDGFDTHALQADSLEIGHTSIATAIASFKAAMLELGLWDDVVVFTMSDFGRSLVDNGSGTDHGWGGHQFVAGGSVEGKNIYGTLDEAEAGNERHAPGRASLIPSVSVEQYAATMGSWFGLNSDELAGVFPNLSRFDTANLGFIRT